MINSINLDEIISRQGTDSVKWEFIVNEDGFTYGDHADPKHGDDRLLPMWVADMDFRVPQAVEAAIIERAKQGVYGYTFPTDTYFEAVIGWFKRRHNWEIEQEWITLTPGVVPAINFMVQTFTKPGDKVMVQRPVYYPFSSAVEQNDRELVVNPLIYRNGRYHIDFDDLEAKASDTAVQMLIFCNPHNPVSRIWDVDELQRLGEICLKHNVIIISDEIHCDLLFSGHQFRSMATISEEIAQNSIICTAPSKTFNLAGLSNSNIIIPNAELREAFKTTLNCCGLWGTNMFGMVATKAAYNEGGAWLDEVMAYVEANYHFMKDYLAEHLPQVRVIEPEGTYLIWADFSAFEIDPDVRKKMMMEDAKVYLDDGVMFGPEGDQFERFNLACPRSILAEALSRIVRVFKQEVVRY
ncbi:MAG: MalY/PatB family protein [Chloroflexota bacterium]